MNVNKIGGTIDHSTMKPSKAQKILPFGCRDTINTGPRDCSRTVDPKTGESCKDRGPKNAYGVFRTACVDVDNEIVVTA